LGVNILFVEKNAKISHKFRFFVKTSWGCDQNGWLLKKVPFFVAR